MLDLLDTQTVCKRCKDLHSLKSGDTSLVFGLCIKGTHIVESVAQLDEDHADILGHGKEHLAQVLHLLLLLVGKGNLLQFGQTVHQHCHGIAEFMADDVKGDLVLAVLHRIVQKCGTDGVGIQLQSCHDLCHRNGVGDIGLSADAELSLMQLLCKLVSRRDLGKIIVFFGLF